jgi:uncharacterized protein (DUF2147 family)
MKKLIYLASLLLVSSSIFSQSNSIVGTWLTEDKKGHVEIYKSKDVYYGKVIWLKEPNDPKTGKPKLDKENPNAEKRSRPLIDMVFLYNFKKNGEEYTDGYVYDCRSGKVYTGKLWLEGNNKLSMRGYAGIFFSTETWTRIK